MNGRSRHNKSARTYIAARDSITGEASFLICLTTDSEEATWVYFQSSGIVLGGKNQDEERIRYRAVFVNDQKSTAASSTWMSILKEDAEKYGNYGNKHGSIFDFRGSIITKAEYDSYREMGVLPYVRAGTSFQIPLT